MPRLKHGVKHGVEHGVKRGVQRDSTENDMSERCNQIFAGRALDRLFRAIQKRCSLIALAVVGGIVPGCAFQHEQTPSPAAPTPPASKPPASTSLGNSRTILVDPSPDAQRAGRHVDTFEEAVEVVSAARRAGSRETWRIEFAPGDHVVRQGVTLGADAGPLVITAQAHGVFDRNGTNDRDDSTDPDASRGSGANGEPTARLFGAIVVRDPQWTPLPEELGVRIAEEARPHVRALQLPSNEWKSWNGGLAGPVHSGHAVEVRAVHSELFLGDVALIPARWPNSGYAEIAEVVDRGSAPREAEADMPASERRVEAPRAGRFRPMDVTRTSRWSYATAFAQHDVWAQGFWNWDWSDEQLPLASVDASTGVVTLGMPHRYGLAQRGKFFITNMLEELDTPGEYWMDRSRGLVIAWLPIASFGASVSVSALGAPMITLENTRDVRIAGLAFERTRGGAIEARGVSNFEVDGCRFKNLGACAVDADGSRIIIERCAFEEIGGRGVRLRGGDRSSLTASGSAILDSRFIGCGRVLRTYNPAIDLEGVGHRVARNEVARHPHIAIFLRGNDHVIEANDIHDVVLETGDAGAVYCGRDWTSHGNVIRGNMFSSIQGSDARFQNAVYLDDMASGFVVESNLFVRCNWGILAGGGRDNAIRNNIFVGCGKAFSYDARGVGWMAPHIADPATSTLHKNYAAMPLSSEPWRTRFPTLATYLTDRFGRPVGSSITGSVLVGTPLGRIDDRECVRVEETQVIPTEEAVLRDMCDNVLAKARAGSVQISSVRIGPVGPVGPEQ